MAEHWVRRWLRALLVIALAGSALNVLAAAPAGAELDERVNRLTSALRCLVCQNQTIADSQAELAVQIKQVVRQQLASGASDQQVLDFMVQRYGEFVLYKPPVEPKTWALWAGPLLLLLTGALLFVHSWHRQRHAAWDEADESAIPSTESEPT